MRSVNLLLLMVFYGVLPAYGYEREFSPISYEMALFSLIMMILAWCLLYLGTEQIAINVFVLSSLTAPFSGSLVPVVFAFLVILTVFHDYDKFALICTALYFLSMWHALG